MAAPQRPSSNPFTRYVLPRAAGGSKPGGVTTTAVGEEAGPKPPKPGVTTMAVGEEGGTKPPKPGITTLAVGEEGGAK